MDKYTELEKQAQKFLDETDTMQFSTVELLTMFYNHQEQLRIGGVSKSLKVEMQYFDSCDCPYQINTFIEKHNIDVNNIISFSENEDSVTMYYKSF